MTNLQFSEGQTISYDHRTIAEHLQHHLVDQKPRFDVSHLSQSLIRLSSNDRVTWRFTIAVSKRGRLETPRETIEVFGLGRSSIYVSCNPCLQQWEPFLYKHEAFHKHMTILSDVGELVPQVPLGSESLQGIQSEIELGTVGAGRFLAILDLSLGFLRRTGGDPTEGLDSYCERWLGQEAHLLTRMHTFNKVQLQHVVSLYEGLEDSASAGIQSLVNVQYRTPLSTDLVEELRSSVEVKRPWQQQQQQQHQAQIPKISAELFHGMLRRFMFRYLIGDQLNAQVPLSIYITDPRLIQWPEDVVDDVDDVFPPSLLVEHSHATYLFLSEVTLHESIPSSLYSSVFACMQPDYEY